MREGFRYASVHMKLLRCQILLLLLLAGLSSQAESKTVECRDGSEIVPAGVISEVGYGESPVRYKRDLYFVGYSDDSVWVWNGKSTRRFWHRQGCGPAAVTFMESFLGTVFLVNCYSENQVGQIAVISEDGRFLRNIQIPAPNDFAHFNSKKSVFVTSSTSASEKGYFGFNGAHTGSVYYISKYLVPTLIKTTRPLAYANGIAVLPDGQSLFIAETYTNQISQFRIRKNWLGSPKALVEVPSNQIDLKTLFSVNTESTEPQGPDGIRIGGSSRDILVAAQYQGGRIMKTTLLGKKIGEVTVRGEGEISYPNTTNVDIEGNTLTISVNTTSSDGRNPGVIFQLTDPKLVSRASLVCTIRE